MNHGENDKVGGLSKSLEIKRGIRRAVIILNWLKRCEGSEHKGEKRQSKMLDIRHKNYVLEPCVDDKAKGFAFIATLISYAFSLMKS